MLTFSQILSTPWPPCVVGTVSTRENWTEVGTISPECHLLEWRIDLLLKELSLEEILNPPSRHLPVLITVRAAEEGGAGDLSPEARREIYTELLSRAEDLHIVALDLEIANLALFPEIISLAKEKNILLIGSAHNFTTTFSEDAIHSLNKQGMANGADLIKIAHTLISPEDMLIGTRWLQEKRERGELAALMGMGVLGTTSRLLYSQLGSKLLYGYLGDTPTAPGQLPAKDFYRTINLLLPFSQK